MHAHPRTFVNSLAGEFHLGSEEHRRQDERAGRDLGQGRRGCRR